MKPAKVNRVKVKVLYRRWRVIIGVLRAAALALIFSPGLLSMITKLAWRGWTETRSTRSLWKPPRSAQLFICLGYTVLYILVWAVYVGYINVFIKCSFCQGLSVLQVTQIIQMTCINPRRRDLHSTYLSYYTVKFYINTYLLYKYNKYVVYIYI